MEILGISQRQRHRPRHFRAIEQLRMRYPTRLSSCSQANTNFIVTYDLCETHGAKVALDPLKRGMQRRVDTAPRRADPACENPIVHVENISKAQPPFPFFMQLQAPFYIQCPP